METSSEGQIILDFGFWILDFGLNAKSAAENTDEDGLEPPRRQERQERNDWGNENNGNGGFATENGGHREFDFGMLSIGVSFNERPSLLTCEAGTVIVQPVR